MNVELPWFLFFLFLIAVPIIIHLLNFQRPKKLLFTRLDFIEKIEQKSKNVRNIKKWLILLSRIGLVVSLVLAFAIPFISNEDKEEKQESVHFIVDANQRMLQKKDNISVFEHTKSFLHKFLQKNPLLTYKLASDLETVRYESSAEYLNEKVESLKVSRKSISSLADKVNQLEEGLSSVYVVSDFHKAMSLEGVDTNQSVIFVKVRKELPRNVFVDSVYFSVINDESYINVDLKSSGEMTAGADVQLMVEGVLQGSKRCEIQKEGQVALRFPYENQADIGKRAQVVIKDSDGAFDNQFYFMLPAKKIFKIGLIARKPLLKYFNGMFDLEKDYQAFSWEHSSVDYQDLEQCEALVFELSENSTYNKTMIQKIKALEIPLVLIPNQSLAVSDFQKCVRDLGLPYRVSATRVVEKQELDPVKKIAFFHSIFKEFDERVNMPKVVPYVTMGNTSKNILTHHTKGVLVGDERGYVFGFDLVKNKEFFNHALSLPVFYEMLNGLNKHQNKVQYSRSVKQYVTFIDPTINVQKVDVLNQSRIFSKIQDRLIVDAVADLGAGFYDLKVNDSVVDIMALNLPKSESLVNFYSNEELEQIANSNENWSFVSLENQQDVENFVQSGEDELYPLWKYCVILALMFLLMEVVLIRVS